MSLEKGTHEFEAASSIDTKETFAFERGKKCKSERKEEKP
jgi:hypothetical protein